MRPLGLSAIALARALAVPRTRVGRSVKGTTGITPDTALRLGAGAGHLGRDVTMQATSDMAAARAATDLSRLTPVRA